jgi:branched-chain amino acid aminotransferase
MKIYIDGNFFDKESAKISVFDHGLLYGDGIFEGIRAYNGRVFRLKEHIERLYDSAKAIFLQIPVSHEEMEKIVLESCRLNQLRDAYIRLIVTRGVGNLGLSPDKCPKPTIICIAATIDLYPEKCYTEGLKLVTASTQRASQNVLSPSIKSLNYLNNIMAKVEGSLAGAQEVVMLNAQGYVTECSSENIFILKKDKMYTPPVYSGVLGGITRNVILELAQQIGIQVRETELSRYDLYVADEMFLTGTGAETIPAVELDGRKIGNGKVGPWTKKFMAAFSDHVKNSGTPIG